MKSLPFLFFFPFLLQQLLTMPVPWSARKKTTRSASSLSSSERKRRSRNNNKKVPVLASLVETVCFPKPHLDKEVNVNADWLFPAPHPDHLWNLLPVAQQQPTSGESPTIEANAERSSKKRARQKEEEKLASKRADAQRKKAIRDAQEEEEKLAFQKADAQRKKAKRDAQEEEERLASNRAAAQGMRNFRGAQEEEAASNRACFETTEMTAETNFSNFEHHPETSVLLCLVNSGLAKFSSLDKIDDFSNIDPDILDELVAEISDEVMTNPEHQEVVRNFARAQGIGGIEGVNHQKPGFAPQLTVPSSLVVLVVSENLCEVTVRMMLLWSNFCSLILMFWPAQRISSDREWL